MSEFETNAPADSRACIPEQNSMLKNFWDASRILALAAIPVAGPILASREIAQLALPYLPTLEIQYPGSGQIERPQNQGGANRPEPPRQGQPTVPGQPVDSRTQPASSTWANQNIRDGFYDAKKDESAHNGAWTRAGSPELTVWTDRGKGEENPVGYTYKDDSGHYVGWKKNADRWEFYEGNTCTKIAKDVSMGTTGFKIVGLTKPDGSPL